MHSENQLLNKGRYRIVEILRQYETGAVYQAIDTVSGTGVLLKEFLNSSGKVMTGAMLETRRTEFTVKAKALIELRNDAILEVRDFFTDIDRHYLVTESVEGATFGEHIDRSKRPFTLTDVARWADSLLDALIYLHNDENRIVHGGIKPSTVRITPDNAVKLLVFNLADEKPEVSGAAAAKVFDPAAIPYLPIEQIWNGLDPASQKVILANYDEYSERILELPTDARSDIYSLAATVYHILTARIPADALTRSIEILEGGEDPLKAPHNINRAIPLEISDVLMNALEIRREFRFETAAEMRKAWRTAIRMVREREAGERRKTKAAEATVGTTQLQKSFAKSAVSTITPKATEFEAPQTRQLELMKAQLREAENLRAEAEHRAAEAERRLREAQREPKPRAIGVIENPDLHISESDIVTKTDRQMVDEFNSDEFPELFAPTRENGGAVRRIMIAAFSILALGAVAFGAIQFAGLTTGSQIPVAAIQESVPAVPIPEPTAVPIAAEPEPQIQVIEPASEPKPAEPVVKDLPEQKIPDASNTENVTPRKESASRPAPKSAVKTKPVVQEPASPKKPAPVKPQPRKKVTLDDLLRDN